MSNYSGNLIPGSEHDLGHNSFDQNFTSAEELLASLGETLHQPSPTFDDSRYKYIAEDSGSVTDWNYGHEGLLPPLRRPDVNQIPADVLALLLKTARFGEILNFNPSSSESNTFPNSLGSYEQDYGQVRTGQDWNPVPNRHFQEPQRINSVVETAPQQQPQGFSGGRNQASHSTSSRLSAEAKEFVPRSTMDNYTPNELAMALEQINMQEQPFQFQQQPVQRQQYHRPQQPRPHFQPRFQQPYQQRPPRQEQYYQRHSQPHYQPRQQHSNNPRHHQFQHYSQPSFPEQQYFEELQGDPSVERVLTTITDIIAHLTTSPGDFHSSVRKAVRLLQESLYDADTLGIIITLIVEQSIGNRNFSYTGAKLCQALNENGIQAGGVTIKETLIRRVEEVFKAYADGLSVNSLETKEREIGLLFFLAELFMNFQLEGGKRFFAFGVAALEIMTNLISSKPMIDHEKVKCVVQVLKLAGWELENHGNPKLKTDMEKLMKDLSYILVVGENVASSTKEVVQRVIDLKKRNWDRDEQVPSSAPTSEGPTPNSYNGKSQHPVYELPESEEDELLLDDEPDEVNEFYEEFLRGLPSKR